MPDIRQARQQADKIILGNVIDRLLLILRAGQTCEVLEHIDPRIDLVTKLQVVVQIALLDEQQVADVLGATAIVIGVLEELLGGIVWLILL